MALTKYTSGQLALVMSGLFVFLMAGTLLVIHFHNRFQQEINRVYMGINILLAGLGTYLMCLGITKPSDPHVMPLCMAIGMTGILWCTVWYGRIFESIGVLEGIPIKRFIAPSTIWAIATMAMLAPFTVMA